MKVAMIGLGKLGLPVSMAMAHNGHNVKGYDIKPLRNITHPEDVSAIGRLNFSNFNKLLFGTGRDYFCQTSLADAVSDADIIFVAVHTPHDPKYEGITPMPREKKDFDYLHLKMACQDLVPFLQHREIPVCIISTVLPGTMEREILPIFAGSKAQVIYNPAFIAMGTTIRDFLMPEFVLLGGKYNTTVTEFYRSLIGKRPIKWMNIPSAETVKVTYNTFISQKIAFANIVGEICEKVGGNSDHVMDALFAATRRIISTSYMHPGLGDGGGCHPRDNIAMGYLAQTLGLHHDIFTDSMEAREDHAFSIARDLFQQSRYENGSIRGTPLPVYVFGYAYKPDTNITTGSHALLIVHYLNDKGIKPIMYDPMIDVAPPAIHGPALVFIGCPHTDFVSKVFDLPPGSILYDVFGMAVPNENYRHKTPGRTLK